MLAKPCSWLRTATLFAQWLSTSIASYEDIAGVNIPTGIPLLYEFDGQFEPIKKGGEYLDPDAAKSAIEAVANQGKK